MSYDLSKRLISIAENGKKVNRRINLSAYLTLRPQINEAIANGWSVKFIWETLHQDKKINFGYRMFLRMVKQHSNDALDSHKESRHYNKDAAEPASESNETPQSSESIKPANPVKSAASSETPDYGNPKGFEWSNEYDIDDLV